jgi:hypothetical protein
MGKVVSLWKYIRRGRGSFVDILDLRCEMDQRLDSGMIFGVRIQPLRKLYTCWWTAGIT